MSDSTQSSYKQIMKATSIFGGVQIFQILIGIIRSKFIALILGPAGIGLVGLYMTATSLIQTLTGFGLSTSAVKDIAEANESDDHERISKVSSVLNKLVWITGLSGALIVVLFFVGGVWSFRWGYFQLKRNGKPNINLGEFGLMMNGVICIVLAICYFIQEFIK